MACCGVERSENLEPLPVPAAHVWSSVGLTPGPEIHAGHQSRVFIADRGGEKVVVKLTDGRLVDDSFRRRIEVLASLAEVDDSVVGPLTFGSSPVAHLDEWLGVVYPFVAGEALDLTDESGVRRMAAALSNLHGSLGRLGPAHLPAVAALRDVDWATTDEGFSRTQLLHGDLRDDSLPERLRERYRLITGTPPSQPPGTATPSPDPPRAPARTALRRGVGDYLHPAPQLLAPTGRFVVCAEGRRPERVVAGAEAAGLRISRQLSVWPREG